jgi:hypothetical protein
MPVGKKEEYQDIQEIDIQEPLKFIPRTLAKFFVSNIFVRTFAHIFAHYGKIPKPVQCTEEGIIKVQIANETITHNETKSGDAPDDYGTPITFSHICYRVDVFVYNNDALLIRSAEGLIYDSEILIKANTMYSFDCKTASFKIKNKTAGRIASYQVVGWY